MRKDYISDNKVNEGEAAMLDRDFKNSHVVFVHKLRDIFAVVSSISNHSNTWEVMKNRLTPIHPHK